MLAHLGMHRTWQKSAENRNLFGDGSYSLVGKTGGRRLARLPSCIEFLVNTFRRMVDVLQKVTRKCFYFVNWYVGLRMAPRKLEVPRVSSSFKQHAILK